MKNVRHRIPGITSRRSRSIGSVDHAEDSGQQRHLRSLQAEYEDEARRKERQKQQMFGIGLAAALAAAIYVMLRRRKTEPAKTT